MSVSTENFLKNIYLLNQEGQSPVTSSLLAEKLNVSVAAVTDMARKMGKQGVLDYKPYRSLVLSEAGQKLALKVIRKHRLWELFLHKVLEMDLMTVHEEAERLEHHTSDKLMEQMYKYLDKPDFDPHGDPIPGGDGIIPSEKGVRSLSELKEGGRCLIRKLRYRHQETSEMYERYGIEKDMVFKIKKVFSFDGSIELESGEGETITISRKLADNIFCTEEENVSK
ncbi:metal-dependent transcriptional regulator [Marinilabilia rubra]|uniref:Transcriptional regulator MntR n=1 Tax=Marinilabilia rubra TaxID=2162893 RepID=A0A2U2B9Q5_9BACT|nr:metal-dependent transcriptional regulator [Marinilabilia rubra]PWD99805.1 metal-dependent transcriptional regulator [Marinilabilia rubra]